VNDRIKTLAAIVVVAVCAALCGGAVSSKFSRAANERETLAALAEFATEREHLATARHRQVATLEAALADSGAELERQASIITALRGRKPEVLTTVITETVGRTTVVEVATPSTPARAACVSGPLTVAEAAWSGSALSCTAHGLQARVDLAMGAGRTAAIVELSTTAIDEWVEVPATLSVTEIDRRHKVFAPRLHLGITGSVTFPTPAPQASGSLLLSALHPMAAVDLLGVRVSGNSSGLRLGVDVIGYNVGTHLPVVDDVWLWAGASYGTDGQWSADITMSTRL